MRAKAALLFICVFGMAFGPSVPARGAFTPEALAFRAVSADPAESAPAVAELRKLGPQGLDILFRISGERIERLSTERAGQRASDPEWRRLTSALDAVSQQRDSYASRLYWYTDIEQAKVAARASRKPILSLRLLGNLNEEFSCANSRFFRAVLYANTQVSAMLRDNFILHWKSVRPAPRVTIDFGDGRKLERTLTGNSIHYVLDGEGRPIDAIPGLYGPSAFLRQLNQALDAFRSVNGLPAAAREAALRAYHRARNDSIAAEFRGDIGRSGARLNPFAPLLDSATPAGPPSAVSAAPLAMLKATVEIKTVKAIGDAGRIEPPNPAENEIIEWEKIASLHFADAKLDPASIALIRSHYPSIGEPADGHMSRIVSNLEHYLAIDTVRNEYLMHSRLHRLLAAGWISLNVDSLNDQVYTTLFLTPGSDPWLGLVSPDTYTGLVDDGIVNNH